ncbi:MAG TPA: phosphopantetheine-binding protein, partial [Pyrinomonadaceae bacterium]|nr:phosphopantetheine-binding protein [Pyrinomonadaceae bacterium]
ALPAPDFTRPDGEESYVAPRNTMEEILAQTCAQILKLERVGIYDNFFELGGASLASVEITAVLNHAGIPLTPEMLFEYQTIAQLADALTNLNGANLSAARKTQPQL